jgi:hypothetical protein
MANQAAGDSSDHHLHQTIQRDRQRDTGRLGNPERSKKDFAGRPMLNVEAIAKARGITPGVVFCEPSSARKILRKAFNGDGRLFQNH